MKKIIITIVMVMQVISTSYCQHAVEEFYIHDDKNKFYLRMPASEIRRILGAPTEEKKIFREQYFRSNYYIVKYPGIEFTYLDLSHRPTVIPTIIVITFKEPYKIRNKSVIGQDSDNIIKYFGNPNSVRTIDNTLIYNYEFELDDPHHFVLQIKFNDFGICDEVSLMHSIFFI